MRVSIFEKFYIIEQYENKKEYVEWAITNKISESVDKSNRNAWQSPILKSIHPEIEQVIKSALQRNFNSNLKVVSYWLNFNPPKGYNVKHTHPGSAVSGCYYLRVPQDSGRIVFINEDYTIFDDSEGTQTYLPVDVKEGSLLLFKSNLPHEVEVNSSDEDRISIAFNAVVERNF